MIAPTLRPYQHDMLGAIVKAIGEGTNRVLCKSPTGTGKTVAFAAMPTALAPWLAQFAPTDRRMLVIAHREELLDQAAAKIQAQNPGLMVCIEQADRHANRYAQVVVASIQTLAGSKFKRLKKLMSWGTWRLVVVDEAHHAAASTYRTALAHLGFLPAAEITEDSDIEAAKFDDITLMEEALKGWDTLAPRDRLLVGVTATPNRSDAIGLGCVFQAIVFSYNLKDAIRDEWLVPIVPYVIETKQSLEHIRLQHGDFNQKELAAAVNVAARNTLALSAWEQYARGIGTLAFTVDVAHAHDAAQVFTEAGHRAVALSGETPKDDRRTMLEQFTNGQIDLIMNCMVLTEGTDLPRTGCILHLKPTKSTTLYEQMTGRGLRLFPEKTRCVVIDLVDVARRHSLQSAPALYGLPPNLVVKGQELGDVESAFAALEDQYPGIADSFNGAHMTLDQLGAKATLIDLWAIPDLGTFRIGRTLDWVKVAADVFHLSYPWTDTGGIEGSETIVLSPNLLGQYEIAVTFRPKERGVAPVRQRTIAVGMRNADEAARFAEAYVQSDRRQVSRLKAVNAPWKQRPASVAQIQALRRMGATLRPDLTMGEASMMFDTYKAKKAARRA